jgi:hypothetical protein
MKKLFMLMFMLLVKNLYATVYNAPAVIGPVVFTIKNISVINSSSLTPQKKLALILGYTKDGVAFKAYAGKSQVYFGVDLATDDGKSMYAQFEKAYWFQQDITVRCIYPLKDLPPDSIRITEPAPTPKVVIYPYWTPFSAWAEGGQP